jgi:hypothetical protein
MSLIQLPLFILPIVGVLGTPLATLVVMKIVEMVVPLRRFVTVWVVVTYLVLLTQAIGLSVVLWRLPG